MENQTEGKSCDNSGLQRRHVEYVVAAVLMVLAGLVAWDNLRIGAGWGDNGPQSGYFPLRIGTALGLCGAAVLIQSMKNLRSQELFATWEQLKRVAQIFIPLAIYIALITPLGIYTASALFIAGFMVVVGHYPWWKALALSVLTVVILFFVFEFQFKVPLPKGYIEAWFGLL